MVDIHKKILNKIEESRIKDNNCKHYWDKIVLKTWFVAGVFIYCKKCGAYKELV